MLDEVSFPLMTVIDFKGYRITAMTVLPLGKDTLVYGTADAGDQCIVKNEVPAWSQLISSASVALGLRPHWVRNGGGEIELTSCVDLEGHRGRDGRMYLLDFSRTFPPAYKVLGAAVSSVVPVLMSGPVTGPRGVAQE